MITASLLKEGHHFEDTARHGEHEYKYGHAWLQEELPEEVIKFIMELPASEQKLPGQWANGVA